MISKSQLQSRYKFYMKDYMKDELFGNTIKMILPITRGSKSTKTWNISALVTKISDEDNKRLSVDTSQMRTVDIFLEDLNTLKSDNPTAYIIYKNFQELASFTIDGAKYKVREESVDQQFETAIRLICERVT